MFDLCMGHVPDPVNISVKPAPGWGALVSTVQGNQGTSGYVSSERTLLVICRTTKNLWMGSGS